MFTFFTDIGFYGYHCLMSSSMAWKVIFWIFRFQMFFFHVYLPLLFCLHKTIVTKLLTVLNCITFSSFSPCLILEANLMLHLGRLDKWSCSKSCVWKQGQDRLRELKICQNKLEWNSLVHPVLHFLTPWGFLKVFPFSDRRGPSGVERGKNLCHEWSRCPAALRWDFGHLRKEEVTEVGPARLFNTIEAFGI